MLLVMVVFIFNKLICSFFNKYFCLFIKGCIDVFVIRNFFIGFFLFEVIVKGIGSGKIVFCLEFVFIFFFLIFIVFNVDFFCVFIWRLFI